MMLTMANTDDFVQQLAASEALIAATQKKKDSSMIVSQVIVENEHWGPYFSCQEGCNISPRASLTWTQDRHITNIDNF